MMRWLKLLEEERKEVKIRLSSKEKGKISEPHAIGKVLFEKPAHPNAISLSLGRVCDGGKEGATKKGEEVTNPHKTVLEPTRSGNPKNLDMEVGVVKEVAGKTGKELEWTGGADGGNNKETTRTEEDNMLVDELQQKEDGSQAKKLEKGNGQEDDSISQG
ncbi:hypothetical protein ZWY2020_040707 [Hordeum vulgare]|nr:hypothetical protein ZWY2020_040707 [Hordeum vulgare]